MALSDYLAARAKVADIQQRLNAAIGDIRANESFSEQGRRQEMAKVALKAKQDAEALKERFVAERNAPPGITGDRSFWQFLGTEPG